MKTSNENLIQIQFCGAITYTSTKKKRYQLDCGGGASSLGKAKRTST